MHKILALQTHDRDTAPIRPSRRERKWMDESNERFVYRCLPLVMANQYGWEILNTHHLRATWDGGSEIDSVRVENLYGDGPLYCNSHFGVGVLTFQIPFLFKTPKDWNLLVRGPTNSPKDGIIGLDGIVETDWTHTSFTMNWRFTRACTVEFFIGEPVCLLMPIRRGTLEKFAPEIHTLSTSPKLQRQFKTWSVSRDKFLRGLKERDPWAVKLGWQKDYTRLSRQTKIQVPEFQRVMLSTKDGEPASRLPSRVDVPSEERAEFQVRTERGTPPLQSDATRVQAPSSEPAKPEGPTATSHESVWTPLNTKRAARATYSNWRETAFGLFRSLVGAKQFDSDSPLAKNGLLDYLETATAFRDRRYLPISGILPGSIVEFLKIYIGILLVNDKFGKDAQCPNSPSIYGDQALDAVLEQLRPVISRIVGLDLVSTYSYARLYSKGEVLHSHKDREACEVSLTVALNVPDGMGPSSIFVKAAGRNEAKVDMLEGDGCVYAGSEVVHRRDAFRCHGYIQLFFHFINRHGPYFPKHGFDQREFLGLPPKRPEGVRESEPSDAAK